MPLCRCRPAVLLIQQDVSDRIAAEETLAELTNAQLTVSYTLSRKPRYCFLQWLCVLQ